MDATVTNVAQTHQKAGAFVIDCLPRCDIRPNPILCLRDLRVTFHVTHGPMTWVLRVAVHNAFVSLPIRPGPTYGLERNMFDSLC
ncbi:hypothetical protein PHO31112_05070 [Pandoraea horticolens]|uniref:Uncharacterized protein n=1 Tax=Pandoraea horticolens TaxID=2508298 RepID=A0A5E4Z4V8_9BURK|nr:hypothetical protein PHO31112_05070 [Pandoraea horticolens]